MLVMRMMMMMTDRDVRGRASSLLFLNRFLNSFQLHIRDRSPQSDSGGYPLSVFAVPLRVFALSVCVCVCCCVCVCVCVCVCLCLIWGRYCQSHWKSFFVFFWDESHIGLVIVNSEEDGGRTTLSGEQRGFWEMGKTDFGFVGSSAWPDLNVCWRFW